MNDFEWNVLDSTQVGLTWLNAVEGVVTSRPICSQTLCLRTTEEQKVLTTAEDIK